MFSDVVGALLFKNKTRPNGKFWPFVSCENVTSDTLI